MIAQSRGRVLFLPVEIAGYVSRVSRGLTELGWQVEALDINGNSFGYAETVAPIGLLGALARVARRARGSSRLQGIALRLLLLPMRVVAAVFCVPRYDAAVFIYGQSLAWGLDAWFAKRRGIPVITIYLGSDSRPPYLDGYFMNRPEVQWWRVLVRSWRTARRVRWMSRHSTAVVCHPPSAQFVPVPFVNWLNVGLPTLDAPPPAASQRTARAALEILHAPSDRRLKGSDQIAEVIADLARSGEALRLVEVSGVRNSEVLAAISHCDLVVDQLYADTPLAGFACEAASLGRPVLTFGYAKGYLRPMLDSLSIPAEHYLDPDELRSAIVRGLRDPGWLEEIASRSREFVLDRWSADEVARRLERLLMGEVPAEWLVDPASVDYILGCGMSREVLVDRLARYVDKFGFWALFLPSNGALATAVRSAVAGGARTRTRDATSGEG